MQTSLSYHLNKGGKFLMKLWCCVSGRDYNRVIYIVVLSTEFA